MDFDVVVLGKGPAGLQCALSCSTLGMKTLIIGRLDQSHMASAEINDLVGVKPGTPGISVLAMGVESCRVAGAKELTDTVIDVRPINGGYGVRVLDGKTIETTGLVLATGIEVTEEEIALINNGVYSVLTSDIIGEVKARNLSPRALVVGSGPRAVLSAIYLKKEGADVDLVARDINVSGWLDDELSGSNINIYEGKTVAKWPKAGSSFTETKEIVLDNGKHLEANFIFNLPGEPRAREIISSIDGVKWTDRGIHVNSEMWTGVMSIFAAGDITGPPYSWSKAVGQGGMAAWSVRLALNNEVNS